MNIKKLNKLTIFLVYILFLILIYNYYNNKKNININKTKVSKFFDTINKQNIKTDDYIAVIQIPRINLERGIYNKNSKLNNVDKNIFVLNETIFPDKENSHIILAAHSGRSDVSYFKNLNKLKINDILYFYYNNKKYIYNIVDIYEVEKTGKINLHLSYNDISLITCKGESKQVIYHGSLIN